MNSVVDLRLITCGSSLSSNWFLCVFTSCIPIERLLTELIIIIKKWKKSFHLRVRSSVYCKNSHSHQVTIPSIHSKSYKVDLRILIVILNWYLLTSSDITSRRRRVLCLHSIGVGQKQMSSQANKSGFVVSQASNVVYDFRKLLTFPSSGVWSLD